MYSEPCTQLPKHHTHCHVLRSTHSQAEGSDSSCTPISWRQQLGFSELPFHVCQLDIPSLTSVCSHGYTHAMDTGTRSWCPMCKYRYARCHQASKVCRILAISLNLPSLEKGGCICKHVIKHITHPWTWGPGWGPEETARHGPPGGRSSTKIADGALGPPFCPVISSFSKQPYKVSTIIISAFYRKGTQELGEVQ